MIKKIKTLWDKKEWYLLVLFLISILFFTVVFLPREVQFMKTVSVLARYNSTRFLPISAMLLLAALSIKDQRTSIIAAAIVIFPIFAFSLNGLWAGAYSENNVIAGLLPRTDALSFYGGAVSLSESGFLVGYAKRRPLFGGFLAFILWISGGNLQVTLAAITYLLAAVCFFSVIEVRRILNPSSAVLYFIIIYVFSRHHIGLTMSETMGILLGVSATTFFLIFLRNRDQKKKYNYLNLLFAIFLFALAQAARPGAVATLPLLILFAAWVLKGKQAFAWKWGAITTVVIVAAFLLNSLLFTLTTMPGGTQTNNIGFGIYGLAVGGKGWEQIFVDHPEITQLPAGELEKTVLRLVWEEISTQPENFIQGMLVQFQTLFSYKQANSVYSFIWSKSAFFSIGLITFAYLLSAAGLVYAVVNRKHALAVLVLLFSLGFLGSLPFAPAYQTRHMRVYAATIPFLAFLPAYGLFALVQRLPEKVQKLPFVNAEATKITPIGTAGFSAIFATLLFIGPLLIQAFAAKTLPETAACEDEQDAVIMRYFPGSSIHIFRNDPSIKTWVPNITQLDYKGSIHNICCDDEIAYFEDIDAPNVMFPALNQLTGKMMYAVISPEMLPEDYGLYQACGRIEDVLYERSDSGFLYPSTLQKIDR